MTLLDVDERGVRVGRVLGVPVFLKPSWFAVAVLIAVLFAPNVTQARPGIGAGAYVVALGFAGILLLSVFVHEVAHSLAASATGTPATHIVLDLWGGHTAFEEASRTPGRSALVAAVGPASNVLIALVAFRVGADLDPFGLARLVLMATAASNAVVAAFNALPGLPLDGGRVLEAAVWRATGDRLTGTLAGAWCGRLLAGALAGWVVGRPLLEGRSPLGDVTTTVWLLLVAWLLWRGATDTLAAVAWQRRAPRAKVADLLWPAVPVPATATVADAEHAARAAGVDVVVLLDLYGRPAAVLDDAAIATVPPGRTGSVPASAVGRMLPPSAVVDLVLAGEPLLLHLRLTPHLLYAVLDTHGDVVGVLPLDAVAGFVTARRGVVRRAAGR